MVKLRQSAKDQPLVFLFQPPPRLQVEGFRWAPHSFINTFRRKPAHLFRVIAGDGCIGLDGKGLGFERPGFALDSDEHQPLQIGRDFRVRMGPGAAARVAYWYEQDCRTSNGDGTNLLHNPAVITLESPWLSNAAVLVDLLETHPAAGSIKTACIAILRLSSLPPSLVSNGPWSGPSFSVKKYFNDGQKMVALIGFPATGPNSETESPEYSNPKGAGSAAQPF